jgi:CBS domain containing-hemolysin-like protein
LCRKEGILIEQENNYVSNILNLREVRTGKILTPRSVTHMLDQALTVTEALNHPRTMEFTRIPVYQSAHDQIMGVVIKHDLYEAERSGYGEAPLSDYTLKLNRVSEKLPVQQLLDLFIKQKTHQFLVEDEFGQTAGIVTLEDAIETLLGREIVDESDSVADMQQLAKKQYRQRLRKDTDKKLYA